MNLKGPLTIAALTAVLAATAAACGDDDDEAATATTDVAMTESSAETAEPADPAEAETTVPDTSETTASEPSTSAPGDCPAEPTEEAAGEMLVGLTEDEATAAAEACGWTLRVVRIDGEDQAVTLDFRPDRVNVELTDGEVTAIVNTG